ncbi:alpha/beta-hydrolase [Glonium stellatum]|uniref:Alpha/beta-hydrolase n=1 Tax=Glonium stellatum TaxID=574774 RepID=A0A8E2JWV8_9PEZI|nr:alpha/beta-hydrolase [Glonium stellatum]
MNPTRSIMLHPSGETTHYIVDDFTDPWKPRETILLQGGFARHSAFFYHWVPALSRHYKVIRRDLRGHGYSSAPPLQEKPDAYTLDTILNEIIDTLDQLGLEKVHYFGESTSGILGEILAARFPERLLSLTICSSPTHLPQGTQDFLAMGLESWPTACRKLGSRGWGQKLAELPGTMASKDCAYRKWWLDQISINSSEGLASYAEFLSTIDSRQYIPKIKVPMLILAPTKSAATKLEEQYAIQKQVENCTLVEINGAGHEIIMDAASECQTAYLKFLGDL